MNSGRIVLIIAEDKQEAAQALLPHGGWDNRIDREDGGIYGYFCDWNKEDPLETIDIVVNELSGKGYLYRWYANGYVTASSVYGEEASSVCKLHVPNLKRYDPDEEAMFVATASGTKYHEPQCSLVQNKTNLREFASAQEADDAGLTPHGTCIGA